MNTEAKKAKILAIIAARGYAPKGLYLEAGKALVSEGKVKTGERFASCGNLEIVWVAA